MPEPHQGQGKSAPFGTALADTQGLLEAEELYGTYRSVINARVPGLDYSSATKRTRV